MVIVDEEEVCSTVLVLSLSVVLSVVAVRDVESDCSVKLVDEVIEVAVVAAAVDPESCLRSNAARPTTPSAQASAKSTVANGIRKYIAARAACQSGNNKYKEGQEALKNPVFPSIPKSSWSA